MIYGIMKNIKVLERDSEGKPTKFRRSEFVCKFIFENNSFYVIDFKDLAKAMELISDNEDYKYPNGLGRAMPFYAYIYPIFKNILEENGFVPNFGDLTFAKKQKEKIEKDDNKES